MFAQPSLDMVFSPPRRRNWLPVALSAVVHLLLMLVWLDFPTPEHKHEAEPAIEVELTAPSALPATVKPSAPEAKAATSPATDKGEPIPQLEDGLLAQRSSLPKPKTTGDAIAEPQAPVPAKPKRPQPVTQNERDFVLGQVVKQWHPPRELSAFDKADVHVSVTVDAQGYFDDIYDARKPWNPAAVFDGYNLLPPGDIQRRTIDAFYQAIRQAQPVRLPPELKAKAPFNVRLDFRFKDAR
jgi:hypothetical protein